MYAGVSCLRKVVKISFWTRRLVERDGGRVVLATAEVCVGIVRIVDPTACRREGGREGEMGE